jgi:hypothetical protein
MNFTPSHETVLMTLFVNWAEEHPNEISLDVDEEVIKSYATFEAGFNAARSLIHKEILSSETEFLRRLPKT